jgi:hypothetical protein
MITGFVIISLAAAMGTFLATDMTDMFIHDPAALSTWNTTLQQSAHGHSNMFGILHIVFGLTMPYSTLNSRIKALQSAGIFMGALAMGPGMLFRASQMPSNSFDFSGILIGMLLSGCFAAICLHIYGLTRKFMK